MTAGNLGVYVTSSLQMSPGNINAKSILVEDGANIASLGTAIQLGLVRCILDGGGFLKDDIYYPLYDANMIRTGYNSIFFDHDHSADGSKKGGSFKAITRASLADFIIIRNMTHPEEWFKSGTGTLAWDVDTTQTHQRIKFASTATASTKVSGSIGGIRISFADWIDLQTRFELSHNINISARLGINVDRIEDTQSTTRAQFGLEGCPAHGTNFVVISSNGNAGNLTATSTTVPLNQNQDNRQLTFKPGLETKFYEDGVLKATTNSANTPSTGNVDRNKMLVVGVANDGTGGIKDLELYYYCLTAKPDLNELFKVI